MTLLHGLGGLVVLWFPLSKSRKSMESAEYEYIYFGITFSGKCTANIELCGMPYAPTLLPWLSLFSSLGWNALEWNGSENVQLQTWQRWSNGTVNCVINQYSGHVEYDDKKWKGDGNGGRFWLVHAASAWFLASYLYNLHVCIVCNRQICKELEGAWNNFTLISPIEGIAQLKRYREGGRESEWAK